MTFAPRALLAILITCLLPAADALAQSPTPTPPATPLPSQPIRKLSGVRRSIDEMLLFYPVRYPEGNYQPTDLQPEDVWIKSRDGTKLHGWYCPAKKRQMAVLYLHGNAGNVSYFSPWLRMMQEEWQADVLAIDYRGYGKSDGSPTAAGVVEDAQAARAELARRAGVPEEEILLIGRSLGGAIAVQLAAEMPCRGMILECTFSSLTDIARVHYGVIADLVPPARLNSAEAIKKYRGPLLMWHGDADTLVPFAQAEKLFAAAPGPKKFVKTPGAGHNTLPPPDWLDAMRQFAAELRDQPPKKAP